MKAMIIADNDLVIENVKTVLKSYSYETMVYRWLLKALDNLEEISPHLIIVSTGDYPRHWKTLTQFTKSGISGFYPQVILFASEPLDSQEMEKAKALGVRGVFNSVDADGLDALRKILESKDDIFSGDKVEIQEESSVSMEETPAAASEVSEIEEVSSASIESSLENVSSAAEEKPAPAASIEDSTPGGILTEDAIAQMFAEKNAASSNENADEPAEEIAEEIIEDLSDESAESSNDEPGESDGDGFEAVVFEDFGDDENIEEVSDIDSENVFENEESPEINIPIFEDFASESGDEISEVPDASEALAEEVPAIEEIESPVDAVEEVSEEPAFSSDESGDDYVSPFGEIDYDTVFDDDDMDVITTQQYVSFMFKNPVNGILISGTSASYNGHTLEFIPDFGDFTQNLEEGTLITDATLKTEEKIQKVTAFISSKTADGFIIAIKAN